MRQIDGFDDVNTSANTIKNGADRILTRARLMRERMEKELDALTARDDGREKVILPIWHDVSFADVVRLATTLETLLAAHQ